MIRASLIRFKEKWRSLTTYLYGKGRVTDATNGWGSEFGR